MYRLFLSLRFLRHHWLMTLIGSFFVGASLVVLVVVMAVMDGFQERLKETVSGASADFIVTPRYPADLDRLAGALRQHVPQVVAAGPCEETMTFVQRTGRIDPLDDKLHYAQVFGVDGWREQEVNKFGEYLRPIDRQGRERPKGERLGPSVKDVRDPFKVHHELDEASGTRGVIVGSGLLRLLDLRVDEHVRIAAIRRKRQDAANGAGLEDYEQDWLTFRIVGVYDSGNTEKDGHCLFLDWRAVQELWSQDLRRSSVRCRLTSPEAFRDAYDALGRGDRIRAVIEESKVPGTLITASDAAIRIQSWRDENVTLVRAIESEKQMILVIAFLIVVAGTSSIFAAQWLLVSDKVREIGILRALGAGVEGVMSIFVLNGFLMGVLGSVGGTLAGLLVVREIDAVKDFVSFLLGKNVFDPEIYLFSRIPTRVNYPEVTTYAVAALVCTLIASAIPALRAGLMDPARALHRD